MMVHVQKVRYGNMKDFPHFAIRKITNIKHDKYLLLISKYANIIFELSMTKCASI